MLTKKKSSIMETEETKENEMTIDKF